MAPFFLLTLLQQTPPPDVISSVDRDRVTVGEEIAYTVRVSSRSIDPIQIVLPPLLGLEIIARSERTEVSYSAGQTRITVLELRLRALSPGRWRIGPIQVRQGPNVVQGDAVEIAVEAGPAGVSASLNPRVQQLLEHAAVPKAAGRAALTILLSSDTALVGQQVDVLTAAWFPRDLRLQLRRPPTLEAPRIDGVWTYPQPAPTGIASTRLVDGRWYDLFVLHQIVFPLAPGRVQVTPAKLHYSVPLAFQFFSQEERYSLESGGASVAVSALPDQGRPPGFSGAVGRRITLERKVIPSSGRAGEALTVDLTLRGQGNVALWPAPVVRWPSGLRIYSDRTDERIRPVDGWLAGEKTFRFLVVPDSVGAIVLPSVNYSFFDPIHRSYGLTSAVGATLAVAPSGEAATARALPPPLLYGNQPNQPGESFTGYRFHSRRPSFCSLLSSPGRSRGTSVRGGGPP